MKYMSAKDASELWGISQRRIAMLCSEQRVPNVEMIGNIWFIPKNAENPIAKKGLRHINEKRMRPFVKWAGGKTQLINTIKKQYPEGLGDTIRKYAEPFVGGGAVLFDILKDYVLDEIFVSDSNAELINTYQVIRDNVSGLVSLLLNYQNEYIPLSDDLRKEYYYKKRKLYNEHKCQNVLDTETAALFIFLNKTCFNGLYRVNSKGEYNVPIGSYKAPLICDEDNLYLVSEALRKVEIVCGDYRKSDAFIDSCTFVYFDPPYRPLNVTSSFAAYTENTFDDKAQIELARFIRQVSNRGAFVLASNSDPKNADTHDNFFDNLYSNMKIERVFASRMINSNANSRGAISELLICNY